MSAVSNDCTAKRCTSKVPSPTDEITELSDVFDIAPRLEAGLGKCVTRHQLCCTDRTSWETDTIVSLSYTCKRAASAERALRSTLFLRGWSRCARLLARSEARRIEITCKEQMIRSEWIARQRQTTTVWEPWFASLSPSEFSVKRDGSTPASAKAF